MFAAGEKLFLSLMGIPSGICKKERKIKIPQCCAFEYSKHLALFEN